MRDASLAIVHGGHGSVSRALLHGLPLLVMPLGRDQSDNAVRVEHHGAGLTLSPLASELEIGSALNRLIREPHFAVAARRLGDAIAMEIKQNAFVAEIEKAVDASKRRVGGRKTT